MSLRPSIVLPTRDRPDLCRDAVRSLLVARTTGCEIIVVDQSADDRTRLALGALPDGLDPITYIRSPRRSASAARNEGCRAAAGEVFLFTDDDCVVDPDWVRAWCQELEHAPRVGIAFGTVRAPQPTRPTHDAGPGPPPPAMTPGVSFSFDPVRGYVAGFTPSVGEHGLELFRRGPSWIGMGASMALRRDAWDTVGGFDEGLGAGTGLLAGEEVDLAYRVARAGYRIGHYELAPAWHHGFRAGATATAHIQGYIAGTAALYAKHVRCGDGLAMWLLAAESWRYGRDVLRQTLRRSRPLGLRNLVAHVEGIRCSWTRPLDARRRLYPPEDLARRSPGPRPRISSVEWQPGRESP